MPYPNSRAHSNMLFLIEIIAFPGCLYDTHPLVTPSAIKNNNLLRIKKLFQIKNQVKTTTEQQHQKYQKHQKHQNKQTHKQP